MDERASILRPETHALDALIKAAVERAGNSAGGGPADTMLFLGNRHQSFPTAVIKDPVLEPVDKLVWMVIMLQVRETGCDTAFPGYEAIGRLANIGSRSTIARSIAILRASRWLTLCARIRRSSGKFLGNLFAVHDEPLPLPDALHLDPEYMAFLNKSLSHIHARVRSVARGVLASIDEDIETGRETVGGEHPIERRLASVMDRDEEGPRRFFAFTGNAVQRLRYELEAGRKGQNHHDQNSNSGSSSCINKTTTTKNSEVSKFELTGEESRPLIYPGRLSDNHREIAGRYLRKLQPEQRQPVLDELEGRFRAEQKGMKPVYDEIRFLHSLCLLTREGRFQPNLGIRVRDARLEQERARRTLSVTPVRESDEQRQQRLAAGLERLVTVRQALKNRETGRLDHDS